MFSPRRIPALVLAAVAMLSWHAPSAAGDGAPPPNRQLVLDTPYRLTGIFICTDNDALTAIGSKWRGSFGRALVMEQALPECSYADPAVPEWFMLVIKGELDSMVVRKDGRLFEVHRFRGMVYDGDRAAGQVFGFTSWDIVEALEQGA